MRIIAIDPGNIESAWLVYDNGILSGQFGKAVNREIKTYLKLAGAEHLAIEMIASYGMSVGQSIFETCVWVGRFIEAWGGTYSLVYRKDVKMHLCGSMRAKDSNIRQALIDRYGAPGTKNAPGATYGISKDVWAALAVATTFTDKQATTLP